MNTNNPELIKPAVPKHNLRIFSDEEINLLLQGSYEILEDVGVHFPLEKALDIFAEHGAQVDRETQIVKIPSDLVETALSTIPRYFSMGGRDPKYDFHLQKNHSYFSTSGSAAFIYDFETGEKRYSTKEDVAQSALIADYLEQLAFYWPLVSAGDYGDLAPLHEIQAAFLNSRKHVQTETVLGETQADYAVEMALALCGDRDKLRKRSPLSSLVCTIAPLAHDTFGLEAVLVFAKAGIPVGFMSMPTLMSTGLATPAGSLVIGNAEIIGGLVLLQLAYPGSPNFYSLFPGVMNPRTSLYIDHSPWSGPLLGGGVELAHAQGISSLSLGGNSNAHEIGWQYAKEDPTLISILTGSEMILRFGTLEGATIASLEAMILDNDKLFDDRITASGFEITPETMALDVIREVGPRGTFLSQKHTVRNMRNIPLSDMTMKTNEKGRKKADGVIEIAREEVRRILEDHNPDPLDSSIQKELDKILLSAKKAF